MAAAIADNIMRRLCGTLSTGSAVDPSATHRGAEMVPCASPSEADTVVGASGQHGSDAMGPDAKVGVTAGIDDFVDISARCRSDALWLYAEAPQLDGAPALGVRPAVCLPKYASLDMVSVGADSLVLLLGGSNRDRVHGLQRVLTYDSRADRFVYVSCSGAVPESSNLVKAVALQRRNARHVVVMDMKLRRADAPRSNTFLPSSAALGATATGDLTADCKSGADESEKEGNAVPSAVPSYGSHLYGRRPDEDKDVLFALDCATLTWSAPPVAMGSDFSHWDGSQARHAFSTRFSQHAVTQREREDQQRILTTAARKRGAHSVVALLDEDVRYRCSKCLFRDYYCEQCNSRSSSGAPAPKTTWLLQFGGYCTVNNASCNDVHSMVCTAASTAADGGSGSVGATATDEHPDNYNYRWLACETSGTPPEPRFYHSAVVVPAAPRQDVTEFQKKSSSSELHAGSHSRMLVYGGVGEAADIAELSSLRISDAAGGVTADLHWEVVRVDGPAGPGARHGHTMVHLPEENMCVLVGGMHTDEHGTEAHRADVWCLFVAGVHYEALNSRDNGQVGITVRWLRIRTFCSPSGGLEPTPRSKHASCVSGEGRVLVFGGSDESVFEGDAAHEDSEGSAATSLQQKHRDSVMHSLHIEAKNVSRQHTPGVAQGTWVTGGRPSTFRNFVAEPAVLVPSCCLGADILGLLAPLFASSDADVREQFHAYATRRVVCGLYPSVSLSPDLVLEIASCPDAICGDRDVAMCESPSLPSSGGGTECVSVFGSLAAARWDWLRTILCSNMIEARSRCVALRDADGESLRLLLLYLYGDVVAPGSPDQLYGLLVLANQYGLEPLRRRGEGALMKHLAADSVCYLLALADFLNLSLLKSACIAQLLRSEHINELLKSEMAGAATSSSELQSDGSAQTGREALLAGFSALRPELQTEVREYCLGAAHVYRGYLSETSADSQRE